MFFYIQLWRGGFGKWPLHGKGLFKGWATFKGRASSWDGPLYIREEPLQGKGLFKGMAAFNRGVVEGMVLSKINGDSIQNLRKAGLDAKNFLQMMKSRPLTLHFHSPPQPPIPITCSGSAVWTLRSVGPSRSKGLHGAKIGKIS